MSFSPAPTLIEQLRRCGDSPFAVRFIDAQENARELPYADLYAEAMRLGGGLLALGVEPGDRVALVLPTGPDFLYAFFGIIAAGAIPVPMYPPVRLGKLDEYHQRTAAMLRASGARLLLTEKRIHRLLGRTIEQYLPPLGFRVVHDVARTFATGLSPRADDIAFIQFSSGTTVDPKPVALSHRQVLCNAAAIANTIVAAYPEREGFTHRNACWLPLYHDMGLVGCVMSCVLAARELTLIPPELFVARPAVWLRTISRYRCTVSPAPNFAYALCAERIVDDDLQNVDLSCWKVALNGAEPVTPQVLQRFVERFATWKFPKTALTPVYGLAEATLAVTFSELTAPFSHQRFTRQGPRMVPDATGTPLVALGKPLPGVSVEIRDPEARPLGDGTIGQVWVRGPSVMTEYFNKPELTRQALREGWLDTGDTGFVYAGELYLVGRTKDMIVLRGKNHAPQDVEQCLDGLEGIRTGCAAAFGVLRDQGEALVVVAERRGTIQIDVATLEEAARRRIIEGTGVVPHRVLIVVPGTLPRTSSGKIQRSKARELYEAGALEGPQPVSRLRLLKELMRSQLGYLWGYSRGLVLRGASGSAKQKVTP